MGKLINTKGSGGLINIKGQGSVFNTKPIVGSIKGQTEDDVVVHLVAGQIIGPGFFMFLTYPTNINVFP